MASIQKKNNKYCVVYYCKDTEGKRKQKWETYDTKNEAVSSYRTVRRCRI